ncbi:hypothetical protein [Ursidibacter arcticus]
MAIITIDGYFIEQKQECDQVAYFLHKGNATLAKANSLNKVMEVMFDDFKDSRQHTLQRVNVPEIRITMSIR